MNTDKTLKLKFVVLFLLSASSIGYELAVMRTFSVGSWSNFGSMVLSIAMLGIGLAGIIQLFIQDKIKAQPDRWLFWTSLLLLPTMALAHILAQKIPFKPVMISADPKQIIWIGVFYLIYAVPFFVSAMFINAVFFLYGDNTHKLYFWNMAGSGMGGIFIVICMYFFPPATLVMPLLAVVFIATLLALIREKEGKASLDWKGTVGVTLLFLLCLISIPTLGKINVSEYKGVSYARLFPDAELDYYSFGPTGEQHVYSSSYLHFAPGLSDNAALDLERMPRNAFKGLYIDGSGPIGVMRALDEKEKDYMNYLPMSAPYNAGNDVKDVLLVRLGGGISAFTALYHQPDSVDIVESDPAILKMMGDVDLFTEYNDNLLKNPKINVHKTEPRAYCVSSDKKYDLIELSLIDGVGLSQAEPYSVSENYTYTSGAVSDYMKALNDQGMLSITVWDRLKVPRNTPKLITTVYQSLKDQGVEHPEKRVFMFNLYLSTSTILVKNSDFTEDEIAKLKFFARRMSFSACIYPDMEEIKVDEKDIFEFYRNRFNPHDDYEYVKVYPKDFYRLTWEMLLEGRDKELYQEYVFNIRPATDQRPYYTAYMKPDEMSLYMDKLDQVSEEWGYLLLLGTLIQSIVFGLVIILIPLITRWRALFQGKKGTLGIILYYACLGLGYMMVEIFLIQRLGHFLGNPIFSISIVITTMLILSGVGSLKSKEFSLSPTKKVMLASMAIAGTMLFYILLLGPITHALVGLPFLIKVLIAVILIAPAGFFMGIPFPTGLNALGRNRPELLPWALGMNGALSVTGSVLAKLLSISWGFPAVLLITIAVYAIAALVMKANTGE